MRALVLVGMLVAGSAWAQDIATESCADVVRELRMRPPAGGDRSRLSQLRGEFGDRCEKAMGGPGNTLNPDDWYEIDKALHPEIFK